MNDLPWTLEILNGLGVAGGPIFAVFWWLERKERLECQKTTRELLVQTLTVASQAANAVTAVTGAVAELRVSLKDTYDRLASKVMS